ncbi:hypothetical protein P12x_002825 [Tundrisphaera lichenicola]|uniref:hypothetical protein n=1 Tax=Tundrisphaera lichenicola TaxID=2029860 RepID=UPI003EBD671F
MSLLRPIACAGLVLGLASLLSGCGSGSSASVLEPSEEQVALREVGEMYRAYGEKNHKPPRKAKDLTPFASKFAQGSKALADREFKVLWGADLVPGSEAVLAFEKHADEDGGLVLLQDGETIKQVSVMEFHNAPKASRK